MSEAKLSKLGIFVQSNNYKEPREQYHIYEFNLNMDENRRHLGVQYDIKEHATAVKLAIKFSADPGWTVCFLKSTSTLYMFSGNTGHTFDRCSYWKKGCRSVLSYRYVGGGKTTIDLGSIEMGKVTRSKRNGKTTPLADMIFPKFKPTALPTPDGKKILVFESFIDLVMPYAAFELYDPSNNTWTNFKYPSEGIDWYSLKYMNTRRYIQAYTFMDDTHFMIQLTNSQIMALDLELEEWASVEGCLPMYTDGYMAATDSCLIFPGCVLKKGYEKRDWEPVDNGVKFKLSKEPAAEGPPRRLTPWSLLRSIALLGRCDDGDYCTCIAHAYKYPETDLSIDVCLTNPVDLVTKVSRSLVLALQVPTLGSLYVFPIDGSVD